VTAHQVDPLDAASPRSLLGRTDRVTDAIVLSVLDAPWLLSCHHRPVVRLADGSPVGVQAVLRLGYGPAAGDAEVLLAAAARRGRLDDVLALTRRLALEEPVAPDPDLVLLPVAGADLTSETGPTRLLQLLRATRRPPSAVVLEVDQRPGSLGRPTTLLPAAARLRAEGVRFAAGDAGTGWTALDLLTALRPEVVVLSRALVLREGTPDGDAAIRGMVELAGQSDAAVLADGVPTFERAAALGALGVGWARGEAFGASEPQL
jgi:EAL domain-containing protein (putative c-di-GMP-specific phosphodiesterase class I)